MLVNFILYFIPLYLGAADADQSFLFYSLQGDIIVIHLYVKNVNQQLLSVILFEDELQVKFATRFD